MADREKLIELMCHIPGEEEIADFFLANGVTIPVRCKDCFANGCCSVQDALEMGDEGYCPKGRKEN